jgi:spore coat polysaccharide biosynthesis protein SpsF (cytidylyltransferase family)
MKVTALIQARLGSTRLPRKALLSLNGIPLIDQVVKQINGATCVDEITLSTSESELDQLLISHFNSKKLSASTGPVDDIVTRLYKALQSTAADILVRVWGDCPFVCGDIIDAMYDSFVKNHVDFISNSEINNRTFPPGLDIEIYSRRLLEAMNSAVKNPAQREFPIEFVKTQTDGFKFRYFHLNEMPNLKSERISSDLHLTIDYPDDLKAAETILKKMTPQNQVFTFVMLSQFVSENPQLFNLFSKEQRNIEYKKYLNQKEKES